MRPPVDSSVSLLGAAMYWSTGRFESIRDPRQLIDDLVAHHGALQNHGPPPAKLLHRPRGRRHDENHNYKKLFLACDGDRAAKEMKDMIREQFFLPAGAESTTPPFDAISAIVVNHILRVTA